MVYRRKSGPEIDTDRDFEPRFKRGFDEGIRASVRTLKALSSFHKGDNSRSRYHTGRGTVRVPKVFDQRVVVKARFVKSKHGNGTRNLRAHLSYLTRSGVSLDGKPLEFLSQDRNNCRC